MKKTKKANTSKEPTLGKFCRIVREVLLNHEHRIARLKKFNDIKPIP